MKIHIVIIFILVCMLGCSKEDTFDYSFPESYFGVWASSERQDGNGTLRRNIQFVFSLDNIQEIFDGGGDDTYILDFKRDFPSSDWEIQESFEQGRYEIIFVPKNENILNPWGANQEFRRAFMYGTFNGQESLMLDFPGFSNGVLYRR